MKEERYREFIAKKERVAINMKLHTMKSVASIRKRRKPFGICYS